MTKREGNTMVVTDEQIKALCIEAAAAGDAQMVTICNNALYGDSSSVRKTACRLCAQVIADAAAQK